MKKLGIEQHPQQYPNPHRVRNFRCSTTLLQQATVTCHHQISFCSSCHHRTKADGFLLGGWSSMMNLLPFVLRLFYARAGTRPRSSLVGRKAVPVQNPIQGWIVRRSIILACKSAAFRSAGKHAKFHRWTRHFEHLMKSPFGCFLYFCSIRKCERGPE